MYKQPVMKKVLNLSLILLLLNGCAETIALLAPVSTAAGGGNLAQSAVSSVTSYGIKKQTGKSPTEHAIRYIENRNPDKKKEKCIKFLEATNSEICSAVRKDIQETKEKIFNKSKIEKLAVKSFKKRRR